MRLPNETNFSASELEKELSKYWFCPNDNSMLQIYYTKESQSPYFVLSRQNIDIGIQNAIALRKIGPEAKEQTQKLVNYIFENDPSRKMINLVGVYCNACGAKFTAPKLKKIEEGDFSKDRARALYEQIGQQALETKNYGPFRVVDHFNMGRYVRGGQQGSSRSFIWLWILGIRTILMMIVLYYILGLQMKVGKRWLPLGPILFIVGLIGTIFLSFYLNDFGFM
ncbi:MAG: hypothetical protein ACXAC8_02205 [Candidatus Hodarchaeales archaeon]|jgi:hypothetical protein